MTSTDSVNGRWIEKVVQPCNSANTFSLTTDNKYFITHHPKLVFAVKNTCQKKIDFENEISQKYNLLMMWAEQRKIRKGAVTILSSKKSIYQFSRLCYCTNPKKLKLSYWAIFFFLAFQIELLRWIVILHHINEIVLKTLFWRSYTGYSEDHSLH